MNGRDAETRKDDLRSGTPYWLTTPGLHVPHRADPGRDRFDVIVVGTGVSGALCAEALGAAGRSVLLVDRRAPLSGSTPASTAMIQHEIDLPLTRLQAQRGARAANAAWRRSVRAVGDLVALSSALGLDCAMRQKPALYLAGDEMGADSLRREAAARRKIGIAAEYLDADALRDRFGLKREAAILSPASASANPARLTAQLLRVAQSRGAVIAAPVEITDMAEFSGGVALATRDGRVLTARHAVFCTGYEFLPQMQSRSHRVTSTWALATGKLKQMPDWLRDTIVWEAADPYLYFRAESSGRLIAGGEDEASPDRNSDEKLLVRKSARIIAKLERLLGQSVGAPEFSWAAPFSTTTDGLPIIDLVPGYRRIWSVMGFGGNGITFSMIAAQIVAAGIAGGRDRDAWVFAAR